MRGSCLCGDIQYQIELPVHGINYCHCRQCRKASGTAFATNAAVDADNFTIVSGKQRLTGYASSPGKFRYFCSRCGSPLYSHSAETPERVYVRIGTLDSGDDQLSPDIHIHVASKAPWYTIRDDLPQRQGEEDLWF
jgi:hypothetical protein